MSGSINQLIAQGGVQANPLSMASNVLDFATKAQALQQQQFALQQAQLQPAYQSMRMLMATNPNPSWDDVNAALAQSKRIGGNVDGLVANATEIAANGGKPTDFMRATALGGMSPEQQGQLVGPQRMSINTGPATVYGTTPGTWSANAGQFNPAGSIGMGFTPGQATDMVTINTPQGPVSVSRGSLYPGMGGGGGQGGQPITGGGGSNQAAPPGPPPGSNLQPGQPLSQKDAALATFAQRESGNQNILSRVPVPPGYTQDQAGSGYYQIIPSTWAQGQAWAGIPGQYALPGQANPNNLPIAPANVQYQVASAIYDRLGGQPWARSAPGGAGGGGSGGGPPAQGAFIGATSAQPVAGGGNVQPVGGGGGGGPPVQPAGGGGGGMQASPTGQPMGQGGWSGGAGPQIPGVTYTPQGPIIQPVSPYAAKQYEQAANDFANDQQLDRALPQRTAPLQQALSILQSNKNLQTGPVQDEINHWQTAARGLGMDVGTTQNITDYQTLAKTLAQNMRGLPGANNSDLARLEAQAASPNMMQAREAIQELAAKQLGLERMRSAQYRQFVTQNGGVASASNNSQFYNQQTADWMSKQDPLAYSVDMLPAKARLDYVNSLKGPARERFFQSYQNAKQLYGVDVTNAPE